jgi:hypothetical protein
VTQDFNLILALYVDDIVLLARETQALHWIKGVLTKCFHMKDLGPILTVLGIRVRRDRVQRTVLIDQSHYVMDMLQEFQYTDCKPVSTPADGYELLHTTTKEDTKFQDITKYQRAVGQLNWLVRGIRLDIAFVTYRLSQYCQQPTNRH